MRAVTVRLVAIYLATVLTAACPAAAACPPGTPTLGAHYDPDELAIHFRVFSSRASRIDLYLYDTAFDADEKLVVSLKPDTASKVWAAVVPAATLRANGLTRVVYYGYRAWGPNWPFDSGWAKGSAAGFLADVDADGNRFNPNKLLIDPYAAELSHDPRHVRQPDSSPYMSGPQFRTRDSGKVAPKGIVLPPDATDVGTRPERRFKDEIIYEVHVRGLTMRDPEVPADERGTYAGAARKAEYLKALGVTAVEFLPVHEAGNDQNDIDPPSSNCNYWCYDTLGYFAPERRYAKDKCPGGPTREFKAMVKAFHDKGIKVYLDVVYNHTGEGGVVDLPDRACVLSWRGLDNPTYYQLTKDNRSYYDNSGVTGNFNCANPVVRNLILDSLKHWSRVMGVDGFRFDLAPILGNKFSRQPDGGGGFEFDPSDRLGPLARAVTELPVRPAAGGAGVDLIAEPWTGRQSPGDGPGYQLGRFPPGWAEWNDRFRDAFRKTQNKLGVKGEEVTPSELATRFAGSRDLFDRGGRRPWHSVNFIVAHDGMTLRDEYAYNHDGRRAWDQGGDAALQRQAARNGFAIPLVSAGVPMFTGGDEFYRTQFGNDNAYNRDVDWNYLDWAGVKAYQRHFDFARRAIAFRNAHPCLRPENFPDGTDHNRNGLPDIAWLRETGAAPDDAYWKDLDRHFLAFRVDASEYGEADVRSIYVGYNAWKDPVTVTLPSPGDGKKWHRVADTAGWMEPNGNFRDPGSEDRLDAATYEMKERSLLILVEK